MAELFTVEQLDYLDAHFEKINDEKYVKIEDCNEKQGEVNRKLANDNTDIKLLQQSQNQNNKLTWGILIGVVCLVIEEFVSKFL